MTMIVRKDAVDLSGMAIRPVYLFWVELIARRSLCTETFVVFLGSFSNLG